MVRGPGAGSFKALPGFRVQGSFFGLGFGVPSRFRFGNYTGSIGVSGSLGGHL